MKSRKYSPSHLYRGPIELEQQITFRINELVSTDVGRARLKRMKELQLAFFVEAIQRIYYNKGREETYTGYLSIIDQLMKETNLCYDTSSFDIDYSYGFMIATGHFGIAKATKISKSELIERLKEKIADYDWIQHVNVPPNEEPFPLRTAAIWKTLFNVLGRDRIAPHHVPMWYPYPFDEIQKDCRFVGIYLNRPNQYMVMEKELDRCFETDIAAGKVPVALLFPDSGTMGKRVNSQNPYEMDKFNIGFAAYAKHANIPIVPIVQVIGQNAEFRTKILTPIRTPKAANKEELQNFVETIRETLQVEINKLLNMPACF